MGFGIIVITVLFWPGYHRLIEFTNRIEGRVYSLV